MVPVGAILAGAFAEEIDAGSAMVVLLIATIVLGVTSRLKGIENPTSVRTPEFSERRSHHHPAVDGGPVMIVNTWQILDEDLAEFLETMAQVREVRLSTGGSRWQMYKGIGQRFTYTETYMMPNWSEHLLQHQRINDEMAAILARARRLDVSATGPISRHFLGFDVTSDDLASWEAIGKDHGALHATAGSVPLARYRRRTCRRDRRAQGRGLAKAGSSRR